MKNITVVKKMDSSPRRVENIEIFGTNTKS